MDKGEIMCDKRNCDNCRYYKEHYVKEMTSFLKIGGHCTKSEVRAKQKRFTFRSECEYWEPIKIKRAERKKAILQILRDMEKHLSEIALILKDEA